MIVGGDVHSGAISEISQSKSPLFTQLTASPVSNKTLTPAMVLPTCILYCACANNRRGRTKPLLSVVRGFGYYACANSGTRIRIGLTQRTEKVI